MFVFKSSTHHSTLAKRAEGVMIGRLMPAGQQKSVRDFRQRAESPDAFFSVEFCLSHERSSQTRGDIRPRLESRANRARHQLAPYYSRCECPVNKIPGLLV